MKQLIILLFVGLCVTHSKAQVTIIKIPEKCIEPWGIIKLDSTTTIYDSISFVCKLERIFKKRTNERIWQVTEFISYLQNKYMEEYEKLYYINSICALFTNDTRVKIKNEDIIQNKALREFLTEISSNHLNTKIRIDSLEIPKWDHVLVESDTLGIVHSITEMTAICTTNKTFEYRSKLPLVKNQTEDGIEWIPLFGNMIVTINKNEDDKKNKRNRLYSVNDQLR